MISDRYTTLTRAIPTKKTTAALIAEIVLDAWVIHYGNSDRILTGNSPKFAVKFINAVCVSLGTQLLTTSAFHSQTNEQTKRVNETIVEKLRHYICKRENDWDNHVQPLAYAYSAQVHKLTKTTTFISALSREPPGAMNIVSSPLLTNTDDNLPLTIIQTIMAKIDTLELERKAAMEKGPNPI